jgi:hypothetical protein
MQISSAVCDVHQSLALRRDVVSTIVFKSFMGESSEQHALPCQDPSCKRYYSPWRGYFSATVEDRPDYGVPSTKPQCRQHQPEVVFLYLMEKNSELMWACPECSVTQLFAVPDSPKLLTPE